MKIAVIVPTYNEKENIQKLIQGIFDLNMDNLHIIVVDDGSPDGTGRLAEEIKKKNEKIHIIHRAGKMGLGTAYMEGFRYALKNEAEFFLGIDADFSHDYLLIPQFIKEMENHDLVVGSRYVPGGGIKNWPFSRMILSSWGNFYARRMLKMPIRDLTTGYKCYRKKVVEYLINQEIDAAGYVFLTETTYYAHKKGFKIKEIPIIFINRELGVSKLDIGIILESFWKIFKLRRRIK
jgi:dolichol-phosphate mannosyltransferase